MRKYLSFSLASLLFLVSGCATLDGILDRQANTESFMSELEERTAMALKEDTPLDLDRCIAIALENNLDIKAADLNARLAKLNRRIAFANFLPEVTLQYTSTELNKAPASSMIAGLSTTVQDRIVRETAVQAQMPEPRPMGT